MAYAIIHTASRVVFGLSTENDPANIDPSLYSYVQVPDDFQIKQDDKYIILRLNGTTRLATQDEIDQSDVDPDRRALLRRAKILLLKQRRQEFIDDPTTVKLVAFFNAWKTLDP